MNFPLVRDYYVFSSREHATTAVQVADWRWFVLWTGLFRSGNSLLRGRLCRRIAQDDDEFISGRQHASVITIGSYVDKCGADSSSLFMP